MFCLNLILARPSRTDESSSESSQRRSYSSSRAEEKPSTTRTTESGSTSTIPKTSLDTESESKKRSRSFARPILRSAVPDSQLLSLARRPVQPGNGRKINSIFILIFLTCFSWSTS
jgi:hypothetical protein